MIKTDYSTIGPMGTIIAQALASEGVDPELRELFDFGIEVSKCSHAYPLW